MVTRSKSNGSGHPLSRYFPHIINKNYLNFNSYSKISNSKTEFQ
ncbi:hypothetical protein [Caldifermentibacillus hisashii]